VVSSEGIKAITYIEESIIDGDKRQYQEINLPNELVFFGWIDGVVHVVGIAEERESNIAIIGSGFVTELPSFGCGWELNMSVGGTDPRLLFIMGHLPLCSRRARRTGNDNVKEKDQTRDEKEFKAYLRIGLPRAASRFPCRFTYDARCSQVTQVVARLAQRMLRSLRVLDIRSIMMRYEADLSKFAEKRTWV
jgi:hypothetical protein